jgi:oligopeptide/dipeptide ABC transporter ATP-binding protein
MKPPIIEVKDLHKRYELGKGAFFGKKALVRAVDGVDFTIERGEILALVGESGCGKSTLARTLMGLEAATEGYILFHGIDIAHQVGAAQKSLRRQIQMIFQDPYESLNPVMTIGELVAEALVIHKITDDAKERQSLVVDALESAGLKPAEIFMNRFPHELSGGQRQRVVIAAALILEPSLLLADEPVSMLDLSIRADILNLLADLRESRGISMLYITHDLSTVAYIADRIAVMYLGRIVEIGTAREVLNNPKHPYTRALLSVVPAPNPRQRGNHTILEGETPNPINLPNYCRFASRCPAVIEACKTIDPALREIKTLHSVACIRAEELNGAK